MIIEGVDRDNPNKSESNVVYTCAFYMMREGYSDEAVTKVLLDPAYGISRLVLEHRNPEKEAKIWIARARKNVRVRQSAPSPVIDVEILRMDDVQPEPIDWLWPYWLAKSKLHILAGMMGDGKSTLAFKFAATISSGGSWPSGTKAPIGNVLIWSGEDSLPDIIRPRLEKMGANLKFVFGISTVTEDGLKRSFNPATDIDCLEKKVKEIGGISLLIIDPIVVVVGKKDSHKNAEVRDSLLPLINFTMRHNCAALGVTHFSKGTGGKDPRGTGHGFTRVRRSGANCYGYHRK
jgi:AAA domain